MLKPHIPQQSIVPALIKKQLSIVPQARINFAVLVEVGRIMPAAIRIMNEQDVASFDTNEQTDVTTTAAEQTKPSVSYPIG